MLVAISLHDRTYDVDTAAGRPVAIRLDFNNQQPNLFGVSPAVMTAVRQGDFVGDTRRGGSCNVRQLSLIPHCQGTHTESVGHIVDESVPVTDCVGTGFSLAVVASVSPRRKHEISAETYALSRDEDWVIAEASLTVPLSQCAQFHAETLVVRTIPNGEGKRFARYDHEPAPAYFTDQAMQRIAEGGCKHLIVDLPSIDRIFDEGRLANHHLYWQIEPGSRRLNPQARLDRTVTEFVYVPDDLADGLYLLSLQIPDMACDAVPSRPMLYALMERSSD